MVTFDDIVNANKLIKPTDVKGKNYAEVNQRILAFRSLHPEGCIYTEKIKDENGVCQFLATIYSGDGRVLGTGTAQEKESSSMVNKTSYIENCVPLDTEILTVTGWKKYNELTLGEKIVGINLDTQEYEISELLSIHLNHNYPLVHVKFTDGFEIDCTPGHRWLIHAPLGIKRIETVNLKKSDVLIQSLDCVQNRIPYHMFGENGLISLHDLEINKTKVKMSDTWCPTTETGTWLMKQGDIITLTSNCETSAVGRALGMCGFGVNESIASADEIINALKTQEMLKDLTDQIVAACKAKVAEGVSRNKVYAIIAENNDGKKNPSQIVSIAIAEKVLKTIQELTVEPKKTARTKQTKETKKDAE